MIGFQVFDTLATLREPLLLTWKRDLHALGDEALGWGAFYLFCASYRIPRDFGLAREYWPQESSCCVRH